MATNPSHTQPSPTSLSPFIPSLNHSIRLCNIPHGLSARPSRHPLSALPVWVPCLPARFRFRTGGSGSSPSSCVEAKACAGPHTRHCSSQQRKPVPVTSHPRACSQQLQESSDADSGCLWLHNPSPCTSSSQRPSGLSQSLCLWASAWDPPDPRSAICTTYFPQNGPCLARVLWTLLLQCLQHLALDIRSPLHSHKLLLVVSHMGCSALLVCLSDHCCFTCQSGA